jgi:prevent-host-death family protein
MVIEVGVRELRRNLGSYARRAAGGELFVITQRGVPVAQLRSFMGDESRERDSGVKSELGGTHNTARDST